jgi:DNA-binding response OmpR family regulator
MSKLVLIVEDNRVCGEAMAAYFRHRGARAVIARDGAEALQITRRDLPDALVLDITLPEMDGVTFLEALRADATLASTPVVVATAVTDEKVSRRVAELGAVGYLVKGNCSLQQVFELVATHARAGVPAEG